MEGKSQESWRETTKCYLNGQDTDGSAQEGPLPFTAEVLLVVASE